MNSVDLTVVVDGGGSGCRLMAFDASGTPCATATNGPASLSLGEEQAWRHIRLGLRALAAQLGEAEDWVPSQLWLGLAGALQPARCERFLALPPASIRVTLVTDGHAQLLGAGGGAAGACVAMGTGSVLHWLDESGRAGMAGGWGYPIGDEGSGAWLGSQLVNAYLWFRDLHETGNATAPVFQALEERIGRSISDVQSWSTCKSPTDMASLVPLIVAAGERGDALANTLLNRGAEQCERLLDLAPVSLPVYLVGGLAGTYRPRLSRAMQPRLRAPHGDALQGLLTLSRAAPPS